MKTLFSIIIPTWNNLNYLKVCIDSILKHSYYQGHEIIVHCNEGSDGTLEWLKENNIKHTHSSENVGVCKSFNIAYKLSSHSQIMYMNDDMYTLPRWDLELLSFKRNNFKKDQNVWLSSTMIQTKRIDGILTPEVDYGENLEEFRETELLTDVEKIMSSSKNLAGGTWPPTLLNRETWDAIGGFDEDYPLGWGSDPDMAKKVYDLGNRNFVSVGRSLVYHFGSKTTKRASKDYPRRFGRKKYKSINGAVIRKNVNRIFEAKHGIQINNFVHDVLKRGTEWNKH